ncbi:MAG TPA: hypothetical protein VGN20_02065 [Mucilaginibacter sp.]|jgi:hypothetical protein
MFLHKYPLDRIRLYTDDFYKNKEVDILIDYSITHKIKFISVAEHYLLILKINKIYFDEELGKEIIGYAMISKNILEHKIKESDKEELLHLIKHMHSTVSLLWLNFCPELYRPYKPLLDENAIVDKVWVSLKKEGLLI